MIKYGAIGLLAIAGGAMAQPVPDLPSGLVVQLYDLRQIVEDGEPSLLYLGFLADDLSSVEYETASVDLDYLCENFALAEVAQSGQETDEVSIRIMDQPIAYGDADPDVKQFMSFYDITTGQCTWH
ncbi:hypothetical protein GCM10008927_20580 [Amylibacter ulvae]|uniref:Acetolactate synthase n=1 Tax=Paramylibacter ulvae TaxID=1651968 RepID=A0ABQ3D2W1_9RHOB|nr:DUF6497 family protein [Amylibacter ulvae]GHA54666.1 hypothetical protein GCM10008927_20580 [Amylibacter ulvae]